MKTKKRKHVSIYPATRGDNGKQSFVISWKPPDKPRERRTFSDETEATQEADRIEGLLVQGFYNLAALPKARLLAVDLFLQQVEAEGRTTFDVMESDRKQSRLNDFQATVETVGAAYVASRTTKSDRHKQTIKYHVQRFIESFPGRIYAELQHPDYTLYLNEVIGGAGKTRLQHLITLKSMSRWARDIGTGKVKFLPPGQTAAEQVMRPENVSDYSEIEVYTPEQFTRLMVFAPTVVAPFMFLGQLAGIRSAERLRLFWKNWHEEEGNKIVCGPEITKTARRRTVDVCPSLALWLAAFRGKPDEPMVAHSHPYRVTKAIAKAAGVHWKKNGLRAGFASYHYELHENAALTAKNDGHSVEMFERVYKSIKGITKKTAAAMFEITPQSVLQYARDNKLPTPEWALKVLQTVKIAVA